MGWNNGACEAVCFSFTPRPDARPSQAQEPLNLRFPFCFCFCFCHLPIGRRSAACATGTGPKICPKRRHLCIVKYHTGQQRTATSRTTKRADCITRLPRLIFSSTSSLGGGGGDNSRDSSTARLGRLGKGERSFCALSCLTLGPAAHTYSRRRRRRRRRQLLASARKVPECAFQASGFWRRSAAVCALAARAATAHDAPARQLRSESFLCLSFGPSLPSTHTASCGELRAHSNCNQTKLLPTTTTKAGEKHFRKPTINIVAIFSPKNQAHSPATLMAQRAVLVSQQY